MRPPGRPPRPLPVDPADVVRCTGRGGGGGGGGYWQHRNRSLQSSPFRCDSRTYDTYSSLCSLLTSFHNRKTLNLEFGTIVVWFSFSFGLTDLTWSRFRSQTFVFITLIDCEVIISTSGYGCLPSTVYTCHHFNSTLNFKGKLINHWTVFISNRYEAIPLLLFAIPCWWFQIQHLHTLVHRVHFGNDFK